MSNASCCNCNSQECVTQNQENKIQLKELVEKHQKGIRFCSCLICVNTSRTSVESGDRKFCCGCYLLNVVKCPKYYINSYVTANAWSFELSERKVHRKTLTGSLPEYFFTSFFETCRKGYVVFNDRKHLREVIQWLNELYGLEYTHTTVSYESIVSCLPLTFLEYCHAKNVWYKNNKN